MAYLGAKVNYERNSRVIEIDCESINNFIAPYDLVKKMRASFLVIGPFSLICQLILEQKI